MPSGIRFSLETGFTATNRRTEKPGEEGTPPLLPYVAIFVLSSPVIHLRPLLFRWTDWPKAERIWIRGSFCLENSIFKLTGSYGQQGIWFKNRSYIYLCKVIFILYGILCAFLSLKLDCQTFLSRWSQVRNPF